MNKLKFHFVNNKTILDKTGENKPLQPKTR